MVLKHAVAKGGLRASDILSSNELSLIRPRSADEHLLSKRLAAKTALMQCLLKLGHSPFEYCFVSLIHDEWGKPSFSFSRKITGMLMECNLSTFVSISDEKDRALAYVAIQVNDCP